MKEEGWDERCVNDSFLRGCICVHSVGRIFEKNDCPFGNGYKAK